MGKLPGQSPHVLEVRDAVDHTHDVWHGVRMRLRQMLVTATTPHQAVLVAYEHYPRLNPAHVTLPTITREAAGQVTTCARDRAALRALCETLPRIEEDHLPALFVGVDAQGTVLDQGTLDQAGAHPDMHQVVGIRPWVPRQNAAPLSGLWTSAQVHIPDVVGPIPALVDALEQASLHVARPLFTEQGVRVYLEGIRAWNTRVPPPAQVRLFTRADDGDDGGRLVEVEVTPALLDREHAVYGEHATPVGPLPCGLYTLPLPRIAPAWHLTPLTHS
ncbi:hypothetical protein BJF83_21415 [Nocardiopsis sp. CNR-923]|nr:hypothetical protein BJF83_21415 [Nocardiopsis sp. CNR-923]